MTSTRSLSSLRALCLLGLSLTVAACSGGTNTSTPETTSATIALTDAATDEVDVFEVDVKNVVLTRFDGSEVSVLTKKARVDFAQLESVSEILVGISIPVGIYQKIAMTLDFSDARVCLVGKTTSATIVDETDTVITGDVKVEVTFATNGRPNAIAGKNHMFLFDLDLNQALSVDSTNNKVIFTPVATAEFDPLNPKPVFTTGILKSINSTILTVERRTLLNVVIGTYDVLTTSTTVFQIDGVNSVGSAGLTALASVPANSRIFVQGTLDRQFRRLTAVAVETGKGTPGNGQDWVHGHIVARDNGAGSNATLTVLGRSFNATTKARTFNTSHTVTVDFTNTKVLKRLSTSGLTTDALGVGQRITAFGAMTGTSLDTTVNGVIRLRKTSVWGTATAAPTGSVMTLNITRFGLRPVGSFNFTVGGASQSTATAFTIQTGSLSTANVTTGSKIRAFGFVNPVDVPSDQDFTAESFTNRSKTGALLVCQWVFGTQTPFSATTTSQATLDVSAALIKAVGDGFGSTTLTNSPTPAKIRSLLNLGIFRIVEGGGVELHIKYDSFLESLTSRIGPNSKVFRISALGTFNATTQTFSAGVVSVVLL